MLPNILLATDQVNLVVLLLLAQDLVDALENAHRFGLALCVIITGIDATLADGEDLLLWLRCHIITLNYALLVLIIEWRPHVFVCLIIAYLVLLHLVLILMLYLRLLLNRRDVLILLHLI